MARDPFADLLKQAHSLGRNAAELNPSSQQLALVQQSFIDGLFKGSRSTAAPSNVTLESPIKELKLSKRSYKVLTQEGIVTVGQLTSWSASHLLEAVRGFGTSCLNDVNRQLQAAGLKLRE